MIKPKSALLPLTEPVGLIKKTFYDYTANALNCNYSKDQIEQLMRVNAANYNCAPYMTALIKEIFNSDGTLLVSNAPSPSTMILIRDGLDGRTANALAITVFNSVIDHLTMYIPDLSFDNLEGYQFDFTGEFDILVGFPPAYIQMDKEEEGI